MAEAPRSPAVLAFWQAFRDAQVARGTPVEDRFEVVAFGDGPALADTLAALALTGTKRATAALASSFEEGLEPWPELGGHVVLVDGAGAPRAIWRTTDLRIGRLDSVDDAFARDEGEGDRTRADWLGGHRRYFERECRARGIPFDGDAARTVFERFRLVWPPEVADPPDGAA